MPCGGERKGASVSDLRPEGFPRAERRGWGRRVHPPATASHPETVCACTCSYGLARPCTPLPPAATALAGTPHVRTGTAAGGDSEGDLQAGGGLVEGSAGCKPAPRREKATVPEQSRTRPPARPGSASPPRCPLAPAPLTGRAWPPLATGLRAGLPGAVGRGGRRQLVRFNDHGGGSGRLDRLSAPPAAPLTQVPCAPRPLREGRSHRPTWCAL